jgi:branched-chain amino acid aminotransferase
MSVLAVAVGGRGVVDPAAPVFRADDEALLRGGAAWETVRVNAGRPFAVDRHLARLVRSAAHLRLPEPTGAEELVAEVVAAAGPGDGVLRIYRTEHDLVVTVSALPPGLEELRRRGLALRSLEVGRPVPLLAGVKTTSYAAAFAARAEAERAGFDDVLFLEGGRVLETSTANVWWRDADTLSTPAAGPGVLPGVTRAVVLELARASGLRVREGAFTLGALVRSEEAFTTSSIREVVPVARVDAGELRPGEAAARLQAALRSAA